MNRSTLLALLLGVLGLAAGLGLARLGSGAAPVGLATFRDALEEADWLERSDRMSRFLMQLDARNLDAARDALLPHLPWLTTDELRLFMLAWSRFDAPGALAWALALERPFHRNAAGAAIYAWAFRDPDGARDALEAVDDADLREFMESRMVAGWAHAGHQRQLTEYLLSLPEGPPRFAYVGMLAWELSKRGPEAVTAWAESIPNAFPRFKKAVFLKAATTLAASDPPGTAFWLSDHLDEPHASGALRVVVRSWANRDPARALDWLVSLPAGDERDAAVSNAFRVWLGHGPDEAERWLRSELPDPALDPAVAVMIARTRQRSPARAMQWAFEIDDPSLRDDFVLRIGRRWLAQRPVAAEAWLARHPLAPEIEAALRATDATGIDEASEAEAWLEETPEESLPKPP